MPRVQFRDATNPDKVLVPTFDLPYDPQDGKEIRVRRNARDLRAIHYRVVAHSTYEAVISDPHESGFVLLVTEIPQ